jgi:hypothetical protein
VKLGALAAAVRELGSTSRPKRIRRAPAIATALALLALFAFGGCASRESIYRWDHYPESVFEVCRGAGTLDLQKDIQLLAQAVDRARTEGRRVAPGIHAHLGYLYFVSGNRGAAVANFNAEKELYPESTTFIDGLLSRMKS